MKDNVWQLCPKCNGTGEVVETYYDSEKTTFNIHYIKCLICEGKMIISSITGKPPVEVY